MVPLIEIHNLELAYAQQTDAQVGPVSFDIHQGEVLGLIGESGAGKSTIGLELLGLLPFRGGRRIAGNIISHVKPDQIAYIPQDPLSALDPLFSIGHLLKEIRPDEKAIRDALDAVHLPMEKISLKSYPHELSGGMRQRLLIALAVLKNPKLIIADEPTSSLDMNLQLEVIKLFREIRKQRQITFLFITHNLPLAAQFCSRIVILKKGRVVESGSVETLFKKPKEAYTRLLIDSVPKIHV